MRDKRPVDELSIEELERILAIKKREERQKRLSRMQREGRMVEPEAAADPIPQSLETAPQQYDPVEAALAALTQGSFTPDAPPSPSTDLDPVYAQPTVPLQTAPPESHTPRVIEPRPEVPAAPAFDDGEPAPARKPRSKRKQRLWMDRLLVVVEVAAVFGIVLVALNLFGAIQTLERETASAQQLAEEQRRLTIPTIAPTPTVRLENVVLPGGHIFVNGVPQFNYSEVPSHLVPLVESQWVQPPISRPPRTSETALSIVIPQIDINGTVVQGVDLEALKQGVGQVPNGISPGEDTGNVVFAAHNDIYGQLFRHLDELQVGDEFTVQTETRIYTYRITETRIVDPNDVSVLENRQGATATLISCYPYQVNTQRIVVFADRIS